MSLKPKTDFNKNTKLFAILFFGLFFMGFLSAADPEIYVSLNGTSEVNVDDPTLLNGDSAATWNLWIKQNSYKSSAGILGEYKPVNGGRSFLIRTVNTNGISLIISPDGSTIEVDTSTTTKQCGVRQNDEWTMITITYDGSNIKYYRNGVLCDTDTASTGRIFNSNTDLSIGKGNGIGFDGDVDNVKIYDRALSSSEVLTLFNGGTVDSGTGEGDGRQAVPAFVYHNLLVGTTSGQDVSVAEFEKQMKYLHDNGYKTLTIKEFEDWQEGRITIPDKSVYIVFDDGRENVYEYAFPIMENYGLVGNIAVVTKYASFTSASYMTWSELNEVKNAGWGLESHGREHVRMTSLSESSFRSQLEDSKEIIEDRTGVVVKSFVFPFYASSARYTEICAEYYERCWTVGGETSNPMYNYQDTDGTAYGRASDGDGLKRITITSDTSLSEFASALPKPSSSPPSGGLKGEWLMNEGEGTGTKDTSGNGNHGILTAGAGWNGNISEPEPEPDPENNAPIITSTPITTVNEHCAYTYDVNATDADGDALVYSMSMTQSPTSYPAWLSINKDTGLITGKAPGVDGTTWTFTVTVTVTDGKGGSASQTYKLVDHNAGDCGEVEPEPEPEPNPDNKAPIITSTPITKINETCTYVYQVAATDADGDTVKYSMNMTQSPTSYPPWLSINENTGLMQGTAPGVDGDTWTFTVNAIASDGKAETVQNFKIVVHNLQPCM